VIAAAVDELAVNAAQVDLRLRCEVEAVAQDELAGSGDCSSGG